MFWIKVGKTSKGKNAPDKNSTNITITKNWAPQDISGIQNGTKLVSMAIEKKIREAIKSDATKSTMFTKLVWTNISGFNIKNKTVISTKENIMFKNLDDISLVIQYLKKLMGFRSKLESSPFEIIPATSTDLEDIIIARTNINKNA